MDLSSRRLNSVGTQPTAAGPFGSENCLFLNVFTPRNVLVDDLLEDHGRGLPVMIWIPGGGLVNGGAEIYDPTPMVEKGVIVVTIKLPRGISRFLRAVSARYRRSSGR